MARREALSVIQRLADSAGVADADLPLAELALETLNGSRSAAHVFKLTPFFGVGRQLKGTPVVLKIAPRAEGDKEKANYDRFVRPALPIACRPDLLAFTRTRVWSGLCWTFAGSAKGSRMDTLTSWLQRGDATKVDVVLRRIFPTMRDSWYRPALLRTENDIAQRYLDRYFPAARSTAVTEVILGACAARYFKARHEGGRYLIGGLSFPSPRALLFARGRKRPYVSCILHGDLNSDNILVAGNPARVTVVDFQKTGRGHVHEDLLHVEESVRINYVPDASFAEILEKERLIALGRRPRGNDPYSGSIRKVRDAVFRYFGRVENDANYHFAVAALGLRLMQVPDLSHVARARITASTLWAAKSVAGEI